MSCEFDSFAYCCVKIALEGNIIELLFSSEGYNPECIVKPHIWKKCNNGYIMIDIRDDYTTDKDIYSWVKYNYDLLIKHWFHEITDKELLNTLSERS